MRKELLRLFLTQLISVLKAPIAIIQKLQTKTASKDNFLSLFLRYTDNETEKICQHQKLNMASIYRPPGKPMAYFHDIELLARDIDNQNIESIIMGDIIRSKIH